MNTSICVYIRNWDYILIIIPGVCSSASHHQKDSETCLQLLLQTFNNFFGQLSNVARLRHRLPLLHLQNTASTSSTSVPKRNQSVSYCGALWCMYSQHAVDDCISFTYILFRGFLCLLSRYNVQLAVLPIAVTFPHVIFFRYVRWMNFRCCV